MSFNSGSRTPYRIGARQVDVKIGSVWCSQKRKIGVKWAPFLYVLCTDVNRGIDVAGMLHIYHTDISRGNDFARSLILA